MLFSVVRKIVCLLKAKYEQSTQQIVPSAVFDFYFVPGDHVCAVM